MGQPPLGDYWAEGQWRNRYLEGGVGALADLPRPDRKSDADEAAIVVRTLEASPEHLGVTHCCRLLAREMGVSNVTIAKVWREWVGAAAVADRDVQVQHRPRTRCRQGRCAGRGCPGNGPPEVVPEGDVCGAGRWEQYAVITGFRRHGMGTREGVGQSDPSPPKIASFDFQEVSEATSLTHDSTCGRKAS